MTYDEAKVYLQSRPGRGLGQGITRWSEVQFEDSLEIMRIAAREKAKEV